MPKSVDQTLGLALTSRDQSSGVGATLDISVLPFNVADFGGSARIANNTPALQAAIVATQFVGGGKIVIPTGFFNFTTSAILQSVVGVIFEGMGRNVTSLVMAAGVNVFKLQGTCTRIEWRDMWIGSGVALATGIGIDAESSGVEHSELNIERVTFQNCPNAIVFDNVHQSSLQDIRIINSVATGTVGVAFYMIRTVSLRVKDLVAFATAGSFPSDIVRVDSDCDTIILDRLELANLGDNAACRGIRFMNSVGGGSTGPRLSRATNCYVEHAGHLGYSIEDGRDIHLTDCHAAVNGLSGFGVTGGTSITLTSCFSLQNQQHGYAVTGGVAVTLLHCKASSNGQQANNTYDGVRIDGGVTGVVVANGVFGDFVFVLANRQRAGIGVIAATATILTDNQVQSNLTAGIVDGGTATYRRGNRFTTGANQGRAAMVNGTVTVNTTEVLANDNILLTKVVGAGTTRGELEVGAIVAATSFVINARSDAAAISADDDSTVFWEIVH